MTYHHFSLAEKVAQMVVVRACGHLFDHQIRYPAWEPPMASLQYWLEDLGVGGVLLVGGSAAEISIRTQQLQQWAKYPLLLTADIEEGVGQRFAGATWFPPPMTLGSIAEKNLGKALDYAEAMGAMTAQEALAIGLNWILGPVVDVNNNPDNPVINIRSFGETPDLVSQLGGAFIEGAQQYRVLTTAKHFPGHGDTDVDSHLELPVLSHELDRLLEVELPPFKEAIRKGVDGVMSAHLVVSAWDRSRPATLSRRVLTEQLREKMGFEGLIVTDALVMGAIANEYGSKEAALLAVEAGADILLMPINAEETIQAVYDGVERGRISEERINESFERIVRAKTKVGLSLTHHVSPGMVSDIHLRSNFWQMPLGTKMVEAMIKESLVFGGYLPFKAKKTGGVRFRNLILMDDLVTCEFLESNLPAITIPAQRGFELQLIDRHIETPLETSKTGKELRPTLLQILIRGNAFRTSSEVIHAAENWLQKLVRTGELQAVIIYGSPYVLELLLPAFPEGLPYVFTYGQMPDAQQIALDTLFGLD